jgi:hypothetical protein
MLNSRTIFALLISFTTGFCVSNEAYSSDFHSPRTDALGGAGHASPLLGDAIYLNPSFMPFTLTHSLSVDYLLYNGANEYHGHGLNASVMDGSAESLFQAGVGYTVRDDSTLVHVAAAKQIVSKILSLGIGAKFIFPKNNPSVSSPSNSSERYVDGTFSATVLASSWFQASAIIDNLFNAATNLGFYREYILGTKFNVMGITLLYIDPHMFSDRSLGYEFGGEFPFFSDFFLRMGGFKNSTIPYQAERGDGYGIGVGWIGPKISLDYAFSRAFLPISALSHNFSVSIFF